MAGTDEITSFLKRLSEIEGIPSNRLVEQKRGPGGGTWLHPIVAMHYAYKLDNDMKVAMGNAFREKVSGQGDLLQPAPPDPLDVVLRAVAAAGELHRALNTGSDESRTAVMEVYQLARARIGAPMLLLDPAEAARRARTMKVEVRAEVIDHGLDEPSAAPYEPPNPDEYDPPGPPASCCRGNCQPLGAGTPGAGPRAFGCPRSPFARGATGMAPSRAGAEPTTKLRVPASTCSAEMRFPFSGSRGRTRQSAEQAPLIHRRIAEFANRLTALMLRPKTGPGKRSRRLGTAFLRNLPHKGFPISPAAHSHGHALPVQADQENVGVVILQRS